MSRFEMDDQFWGHHKTKRALRSGAEAIQMWMAMRFYVAINNSGGLVPDEDIEDLDGAPPDARKWLSVLVGCGKPLPGGGRGPGLVDQVDGFWGLHDYEDHGLSPEEIEHRKELSRDRQKRWRQGRLPVPSAPEGTRPCNAVSNASRNGVSNASTNASRYALGDVPDPIRSEELRSDPEVGSKDLTAPRENPPPPASTARVRSEIGTPNAGTQPGQGQSSAPKPAHSEPPAPNPPSSGNVAPLAARRVRATDDLMSCQIGELAQRCRANQHDASFAPIGERPELVRFNAAWSTAVGLSTRPLGTYSERNKPLLALLDAFAITSEADMARVAEQAAKDDWCTGRKGSDRDQARKRDIGCLSPTVLRRLLDAADATRPKAVSPRVAAMLAEEEKRRSGT